MIASIRDPIMVVFGAYISIGSGKMYLDAINKSWNYFAILIVCTALLIMMLVFVHLLLRKDLDPDIARAVYGSPTRRGILGVVLVVTLIALFLMISENRNSHNGTEILGSVIFVFPIFVGLTLIILFCYFRGNE